MDLALADSAQRLFDYCAENNMKIEILVNNAGIFFFKDIVDTRPSRVETMINLQVLTPALLCRLFTEQMIRENIKGYILNMASISAWMMMPGITLYSSTKSFLYCFSRAMRREAIDNGVSITTICPGAVATGLYNLSPRYLALGVRLGIIFRPQRIAVLALNKMFQRKQEYIPGGFINRFFVFLVRLMPEWAIRKLRKTIKGIQEKK
jgi:short-subunit dehydrogenase